ncbi:hypothetical protein [Psychrobacter sp. I-STPA6b]|uniref:hypothetical protein n=1 Tax=Psychrobacter sp. I-STPA6b TaxID=2585718 RepID=UPI001D0C51F0|nr:hypothetical protein [Psychrobacter sp. I-STPA6b]
MIYEFIATITAGFGLAGIALIIRHLSSLAGKPAPKWLIPVFAAIGILGFQIYQEYNWYQQQYQNLPEQLQVVKTIENSVWFRPWSYIKPQIVRFIAIDKNSIAVHQDNHDLRKVDIYLFERRMSTKVIPQIIDCSPSAIKQNVEAQQFSPKLIQEVCQPKI